MNNTSISSPKYSKSKYEVQKWKLIVIDGGVPKNEFKVLKIFWKYNIVIQDMLLDRRSIMCEMYIFGSWNKRRMGSRLLINVFIPRNPRLPRESVVSRRYYILMPLLLWPIVRDTTWSLTHWVSNRCGLDASQCVVEVHRLLVSDSPSARICSLWMNHELHFQVFKKNSSWFIICMMLMNNTVWSAPTGTYQNKTCNK